VCSTSERCPSNTYNWPRTAIGRALTLHESLASACQICLISHRGADRDRMVKGVFPTKHNCTPRLRSHKP
jgi:hypothetical protein